MDRFAGRVALVTGVSAGIGARIAEDLVRAGVVVVGVARRQHLLQELADRLSGEKGKLHPVPADLSRPEEVRRVYQWVEDNLGGVSVVVNNAGKLALAAVQDLEAATVAQLVDTNLTGLMLSSREALLNMRRHGVQDGHIVNINSSCGHSMAKLPPPMSMSVYGASKHGVTAFTKGLRYDAQRLEGFKIRVTSISPGAVFTEMTQAYAERLEDTGSILKPKDVSDAVLYVLSCPPTVEITELTIKPTGEVL